MKKGIINKVSWFLIIAGIFVIVAQPVSLTGAVIDVSDSVSLVSFILGLGLMIGGALMFVTFGDREKYTPTKFKPLADILTQEGRDPDSVFVVDTSGIIDHKSGVRKMIQRYGERTYIPKSVISELEKNPGNERFLNNVLPTGSFKQLNIGGAKKAGIYNLVRETRNEARIALDKTEKHRIYLRMRDIINENDKKPDYMHEDDFGDYKQELDKLDNALMMKYDKDPTKKNRLWLLRKHSRANKGDLDVLMNALFLAKKGGKKVKILARDSHLREAVENLQSGDSRLKVNLKYIQYSEKDEDDY